MAVFVRSRFSFVGLTPITDGDFLVAVLFLVIGGIIESDSFVIGMIIVVIFTGMVCLLSVRFSAGMAVVYQIDGLR